MLQLVTLQSISIKEKTEFVNTHTHISQSIFTHIAMFIYTKITIWIIISFHILTSNKFCFAYKDFPDYSLSNQIVKSFLFLLVFFPSVFNAFSLFEFSLIFNFFMDIQPITKLFQLFLLYFFHIFSFYW